MPTPQQSRVAPPARASEGNQWRTNRALTQGLDELPFFPTFEVHIPFPNATISTSSTTLASYAPSTAGTLAIDIKKSEPWTDLVIDYRAEIMSTGTAQTALVGVRIIDTALSTEVVVPTPIGRKRVPQNLYVPIFGHIRLGQIPVSTYPGGMIPPGDYRVEMLWSVSGVATVVMDGFCHHLLQAREEIPAVDLSYVTP